MARLLFLGTIVFALLLLGLGTLNGAVLSLLIPLIVYLLAGLFFGPGKLRLKLHRRLSANRISPLTAVQVTLSITNHGASLEEVHLSNFLPQGLKIINGELQLVLTLPKGETVEIQHTITGQRGYYDFPDLHIAASDHFNLFPQKMTLPAPAQIFVIPQSPPLKRVDIRPRQTRIYAGQVPAHLAGPGVEFFGLRGYEPGDPLRWIDWKTSARHTNNIYTKQFQQERVVDIGLILDTRIRSDVGAHGASLLEHSIHAATALAETFLRDGNRVGLLMYGSILDWTYPAYGKVQRERIMQSLARAQLGDSLVFGDLDNLPTRLFPPNSQLVLISPLIQGDYDMLVALRSRGYNLLIISPDPVHFEELNSPTSDSFALAARIAQIERTLLLRRLRQAGILIVNWRVDQAFEQVAHASLSRVPLWRNPVGIDA